jgi:hypothetical protein
MPSQHIRRVLNPSWPPDRNPVIISKFRVESYVHDNLRYRSPFDLLDLFLSCIDEAPFGATRRNFYLPPTAMYARWCSRIGSPCPAMFQCAWRSHTAILNKRTHFFLVPLWADTKQTRSRQGYGDISCPGHDSAFYIDSEAFRLTNWGFKVWPVRRERRGHGQTFGVCADCR